jgi:hypothetical protein
MDALCAAITRTGLSEIGFGSKPKVTGLTRSPVGASTEGGLYVNLELLRSLQVDHELIFEWLLNRNLPGGVPSETGIKSDCRSAQLRRRLAGVACPICPQ